MVELLAALAMARVLPYMVADLGAPALFLLALTRKAPTTGTTADGASPRAAEARAVGTDRGFSPVINMFPDAL